MKFTHNTFKKYQKLSIQAQVGTCIPLAIKKYVDPSRKIANSNTHIPQIIQSFNGALASDGIELLLVGDIYDIAQSIASVKSVFNKPIKDFDLTRLLYLSKSCYQDTYNIYSDTNLSAKEFFKLVLPLAIFIDHTDNYFEEKTRKVFESGFINYTKVNERYVGYRKLLAEDKQLLKLLAYMYKIDLIDFVITSKKPATIKLINSLKSGVSDTKQIQPNSVSANNTNYQNPNTALDPLSALFNNAYKTHYVSGKNGKHSQHKSPIPHWRCEHKRTLRNGVVAVIPATYINPTASQDAA